ncbi:LacI family DNA-binding transcriptional regulator [Myceligenerans pegani]|uniref:LacI family DNA-binding transcriptional regulator n=1 Tax=Myceligenerans pegani TaxID=2776917 RepID=A0ABR9MVC4_9MICO|nr:LacI family DNA-binding transcriptional regulator [Myceligenerans sp. TRM 65318]MBE1875341.1 LacI family DNA-binding transcriptional regulator [Myceligenerans sp. TRM 65318]MBE3017612.1 LacI family DNA-binding transcriptional regulator [Myceligenerans sp. TRM 65318]
MGRRLADVAEKVGVSEATVSRVLNGKPGVSAATREAVLTALDVLGYERPVKLRGDRGRLVGLVLPELVNPIFPAFAEVMGGALAQQGFTPVLCTRSAGGITEAEYIDLLLTQQVSGVIFAGGLYAERDADHEHYERLESLGLPVVLINASIDELGFPHVSCDDLIATHQGLEHLVSMGHERIGLLLGPGDHVPSERKLDAARSFAARVGIEFPDELVVHSRYGIEAGQAAGAKLVDRGVTAILAASDPLALGAIRAVRRAGLDVPRDVSVVGYDDSALMNSTDPALTTVRQPIDQMGRAAVDLLAGLIEGATVSRDELLFEPELVVRRSTAAARPRT